MDWHSLRGAIEAWRAMHWPVIAGRDVSRWTPTVSPFVPDEWPPDGSGRVTAYLGGFRPDPNLPGGVLDIAFWAAVHADVRRPGEVSGELITDALVELGPRGVRPLDEYERWLVESEDSIDAALFTAVTSRLDEVQAPMLREYYRMWVALNPRDALFIQPRHPVFFQWLGPAGTVERITAHYYALREWFYDRQHGSGRLGGARQRLVLHLAGRAVPVETQHFLLGRSADCDLPLPGNGVSREHATITYAQGAYWLNDLGSSFGTTRDGERVKDRSVLLNGSTLVIGANEIRCEVTPVLP